MTIDRHRTIKRPRSRLPAGVAGALAMLLLGAAPAAAEPVFDSAGYGQSSPVNAPTGTLVGLEPGSVFDNAGTNPHFTAATFSNPEYLKESKFIPDGRVFVRVKSDADLLALSAPPPNPFTFTAEVTIENDEGETASGAIWYKTWWDNKSSNTGSVVPAPEPPQPVFTQSGGVDLPLNTLTDLQAEEYFDNAGTNARFTDVMFSTTEYYRSDETGIRDDRIYVRTKSADALNALAAPPPDPFTVTATATMENDEGKTATGTFAFKTTYARASTAPALPSGTPPTFVPQSEQTVPENVLTSWKAAGFFNDAGTNPRFTGVTFSTMDYYRSDVTRIWKGRIFIRTKSADDLNALADPPSDPFTVTAAVTMENDEGHTATGTFAFKTSYSREE